MKKTIKLTFLLSALLSMVSNKTFAYDIAVENDDKVKIYYNYSSDGKELSVTYFSDQYSRIYLIPNSSSLCLNCCSIFELVPFLIWESFIF